MPVHAGSEWYLFSCLCSFSFHDPCRCRSVHLSWCCLTYGSETAIIRYLYRYIGWHVQFLQNTLMWMNGSFLWAEIPRGEFSLQRKHSQAYKPGRRGNIFHTAFLLIEGYAGRTQKARLPIPDSPVTEFPQSLWDGGGRKSHLSADLMCFRTAWTILLLKWTIFPTAPFFCWIRVKRSMHNRALKVFLKYNSIKAS